MLLSFLKILHILFIYFLWQFFSLLMIPGSNCHDEIIHKFTSVSLFIYLEGVFTWFAFNRPTNLQCCRFNIITLCASLQNRNVPKTECTSKKWNNWKMTVVVISIPYQSIAIQWHTLFDNDYICLLPSLCVMMCIRHDKNKGLHATDGLYNYVILI